ncbi:MAG: UspA family universal stress protein [Saliniramus fredricksonii]|uniref:Universal stress protein family protein n=1 Tax=Saliniramus fredricksonii TaxID=1653334 RepID=A0A0N8KEI9_9HYPH|nr:universal stress protein [Saliniramus fredricksonii]KPQ11466.1 MAG: UspA family universal stress protein [Saliniramus fredricksonii]SCC82373.1 Universal stress protein family protein [Saliniramus fredricksonii]
MSYKEIFVVLSPEAKAVGPYAASLARAFDASTRAAGIAIDPTMPSYVIPEMPSDVLEQARAASREEAQARLASYEAKAGEVGVHVDGFVLQGMMDRCAGQLERMARYYDLTVVEQPGSDREKGGPLFVEAMLFGSGRPLLIVPYIQRAPMKLDHVIVAWDESATAAKAVTAAMPLLKQAGTVEIVGVSTGAEAERERGERLAKVLSGHGIKTKARMLTNVGSVSDSILSHAADNGADLIVMGGYGHSRMRELVLGGATRGILESMTVPVLMMH